MTGNILAIETFECIKMGLQYKIPNGNLYKTLKAKNNKVVSLLPVFRVTI